MRPSLGCRWRHSVSIVVGVVLALLASGCMRGVVRDADTGKPIAGAKVTFGVGIGHVHSAMTDASGAYAFTLTSDEPAASGTAAFVVEAPGYETLSDVRAMDHADKAPANLSNPSSFWEVQSFDIARRPGGYRDAKQRFAMTFPPDWTIEPAPFPNPSGPDFSEVIAGPSVTDDGGPEECTVVSKTLRPGENPETQWVPALVPYYKVVHRGNAEVAGERAIRIVYEEGDPQPPDTDQSLEGLAFLFERNEQAWAIDCLTDHGHFQTKVSAFETIAKSFQFDK